MGKCPSTNRKHSNIPKILFYLTKNNEEQKNYCLKLIKNILKSDEQFDYTFIEDKHFSIKLYFKGRTHIIKKDSDLSDKTILPAITIIKDVVFPLNDNVFSYSGNSIEWNDSDDEDLDDWDFRNRSFTHLEHLNNGIIKQNTKFRNENRIDYEGKNKQINKELVNICKVGNIIKQQIEKEKLLNPNKYIEVKDALKLENKDPELFVLGLLGDALQKNGTEVIIEKNINKNKDDIDVGTTCLQFISTGLSQKTKYDLHFDFGKKRNDELLTNEQEYKKFKNRLIEKLSKDYNIPKNKIIVAFPEKGSFKVQVIFQSNEFNNLNIKDFINKFKNDDNYPELKNLKEIHTDVIMGGCKLSKNQLDSRGNKSSGWPKNEKRGNMPYYSPEGWIGIGLNVYDKYDNGNNDWIGMINSNGEWAVAYHGVGRWEESNEVKSITGKIVKSTFLAGKVQVHKDCMDQYHKGKIVGKGVYCTPSIQVAESYSGTSYINGVGYKTVLMVRVKPDSIRGCNCSVAKDYWVLNGTTDEIRPYRILYKKC